MPVIGAQEIVATSGGHAKGLDIEQSPELRAAPEVRARRPERGSKCSQIDATGPHAP
ncbi:hypothetical protein [Aeromonas media]|uniref:hypothetical protein n=1 Tax=Aeromonas media TaxID=651 RepID=UPI0038D1CE67